MLVPGASVTYCVQKSGAYPSRAAIDLERATHVGEFYWLHDLSSEPRPVYDLLSTVFIALPIGALGEAPSAKPAYVEGAPPIHY